MTATSRTAPVDNLTTSRTIAASPSVLFRLLVDTGSWSSWGPSVRGVEGVSGRIRLGTTGRVVPVVGPSLPFEVTAFDDRGERGGSWGWRVAGVPATTHTVGPHPSLTGRSVVTFGVPVWAPPYLAVCAVALRRLERLAVGG